MAGLSLHARDLAKFGQLVLNDGVWNGQSLVDPDYLISMLSAGQPHRSGVGLLWWIYSDENSEPIAYGGNGYLGQYLLIVPEYALVAVRQVAQSDDYDPETDGFREFTSLVLKLVD